MFRKTLSVVLALAMLCTMVPAFALTASAEDLTGMDYLKSKLPDIALPDSMEMNVDAANATVEDLPGDDELTYVLVASNVAAKSNFTGTMNSSNLPNPFIATTKESGTGVRDTDNVNGVIVVPGTEAQEFQLVTLARSPGATVEVTIDNTLVDDSLGGGYITKARWYGAGFFTDLGDPASGTLTSAQSDGWNVAPSWDWGKTVILEPGVHNIKVKVKSGTSGGLHALILTTAKGHDWTKIQRMRNGAYTLTVENAAIANSFGAAGLIDFTAPAAVENAAANAGIAEATLTWDAIEETAGYTDAYAYEVTVTGAGFEETKTVIEEEVTFEGLSAETEYTYSIKAMDMVGNVGAEATGTFETGSAADADEAYFPASYEIAVSDVTKSSFQIEWEDALLGANAAEGAISYAVYVDDELYMEQPETVCTISDLVAETSYAVKVVPMLDGVEGVLTALTKEIKTADLAYASVTAGPLLAYETANNGAGWINSRTEASINGSNQVDRYWLSPDEAAAVGEGTPCYFVGNGSANAQSTTINIPENGKYYVVARAHAWKDGSNRHVEVKIDGTAAQANSVEGTRFCGWDDSAPNNEPAFSANRMVYDYSETPVELTAGAHTLAMQTKQGWVRIDYVGLVKEADYDGNGTAENADIYWLLNNVLTSKANVLDFFGFNLINEDDVTFESTEDNEVEIAWKPTTQAKGNKDITYELSINGNVTKIYDFQGRNHTYTMTTDPEFGGLNIGENVIKFVMKNGNEVVLEKSETFTISAEDLTTAYFSGAALNTTFDADTDIDTLASTLDLVWDAAIVNDGEFEGSYNVYVNDELVGNTAEPAYEITGLEEGLDYEVKVAIVEDGEVLDSYVTTLTKMFRTAKTPAIEIVGEAGETSVVLDIKDMYDATGYEIALFGAPAVWEENEDGYIVISELLPGTDYTITVKSDVAHPYAETFTYVHDKFNFTTAGDAAGEATYTSGMPIINGNLAKAQGLLGDDTNAPTNNGKWNYLSTDGYKGIFGQAGAPVLYTQNGCEVSFTINSATEAQYYLGAQVYCYSAGRACEVYLNGTKVASFAASSLNDRVISDLITLNEGANTVTLKGIGSITRLDHIVFLTGKSKADALAKYTAASGSAANLEAAYGIPTSMVSDANITMTQLGTDSIMVAWTPNEVAADKNLTFALTLNNGETITLGNNARRYTYSLDDGIVLGENTLKFVVTDEFGAEEVYTKTLKISTLLEVGVDAVMVQEEVGGVMTDTDLVDVVTINVTNPTGEVKNVKIMAVVYNNNRVIEKHFVDAELLLSESATFDLVNNAKAIKPTVKLTPALTQVKYFVLDMDNNAYLPLEINY